MGLRISPAKGYGRTVLPEDKEGEVGALSIGGRGCDDGVIRCHLHPCQVLHIDIPPLV